MQYMLIKSLVGINLMMSCKTVSRSNSTDKVECASMHTIKRKLVDIGWKKISKRHLMDYPRKF